MKSDKQQTMVVSLRRGICMKDLGAVGTESLAQLLSKFADFVVTDELPSGRVAGIKISDTELQKLTASVGKKCHIVKQSDGHVDL